MWPFSNPSNSKRDSVKHNGRELVAAGATLLDVRTSVEFRLGHVTGAVNIPVQELASRITELGATGRPLVVYCRSGARSASAAMILKKAGHEVLDIGGISNW